MDDLSTDLWGQAWNSLVTRPFWWLLESLGAKPGDI